MASVLIKDLSIGDVVSFVTYGVVGSITNITGKIVSMLNSDGIPDTSTAPTDHVNIYRELPVDVKAVVADDYTSYNYIAIMLINGEVIYIGEPWIIESSLVLDLEVTATIIINEFRDVDVEPLKALLLANGYKVGDIVVS